MTALSRYLECILDTVSESYCEHYGQLLSCTLSIGATIRTNEDIEELLQKNRQHVVSK